MGVPAKALSNRQCQERYSARACRNDDDDDGDDDDDDDEHLGWSCP